MKFFGFKKPKPPENKEPAATPNAQCAGSSFENTGPLGSVTPLAAASLLATTSSLPIGNSSEPMDNAPTSTMKLPLTGIVELPHHIQTQTESDSVGLTPDYLKNLQARSNYLNEFNYYNNKQKTCKNRDIQQTPSQPQKNITLYRMYRSAGTQSILSLNPMYDGHRSLNNMFESANTSQNDQSLNSFDATADDLARISSFCSDKVNAQIAIMTLIYNFNKNVNAQRVSGESGEEELKSLVTHLKDKLLEIANNFYVQQDVLEMLVKANDIEVKEVSETALQDIQSAKYNSALKDEEQTTNLIKLAAKPSINDEVRTILKQINNPAINKILAGNPSVLVQKAYKNLNIGLPITDNETPFRMKQLIRNAHPINNPAPTSNEYNWATNNRITNEHSNKYNLIVRDCGTVIDFIEKYRSLNE